MPDLQRPQRSALAFPREPDVVARRVNLAWELERERLAREARAADPLTMVLRRLDELDARLEAIEAALFVVFLKAGAAEDGAALAVEMAESAT